jgi:hypothetical protein
MFGGLFEKLRILRACSPSKPSDPDRPMRLPLHLIPAALVEGLRGKARPQSYLSNTSLP